MVTSRTAAVTSVLAVAALGCASAPARTPLPHHPRVATTTRTPARAAEVSFAPAPQRPITGAFDADGRRVASVGEDGELAVWAIDGSTALVRLPHAIPKGSGTPLIVWGGNDSVVIRTEEAVLRAELAPPRITTLLNATANVSPDGRRAARVLDAKAGIVEAIDTRDGHTDARLTTRLSGVSVVAWIDRNDALALRDAPGHLEIWDVDKGTRRARCKACSARGEPDGILDGALSASPDGRFFTSRRWDLDPKGHRVDVFEASTGTVRARLASCTFYFDPVQPRSTTSRVTWSPDGQHFVLDCVDIEHSPSAGAYAAADLYDTASWSLLRILGGDVNLGNVFLEVTFSANSSRLFTWSTSDWDGEVVDVTGGKPRTLTPHTGGRPSPDGRLVLGEDGFVREVDTARVIAGLGTTIGTDDLAFGDGVRTLAVLNDDHLRLWPLGSGSHPAPTTATTSTDGLRWTGRGELLATDFTQWWPSITWRRFDAVSGAPRAWGHPVWSASHVLSPDGTALASIRPCDGADTTEADDATGMPPDSCVELVVSEPDGSRPRVIERIKPDADLAWSADGASIGVADAGVGLRTHDAATGARRGALSWPTTVNGYPTRTAVANGGMRLGVVVDGDTKALIVADFRTGDTHVIMGRYKQTLGWTTDGHYLVAQAANDSLVVLDATTYSVVRTIDIRHTGNPQSLVARDIPRLVGSSNTDAWLRVERALARCGDPTHVYGPCALSSDGRFVAWVYRDGADDAVELVRLEDGARLKLQQHWLGSPVFLVSDQSGHFDCNDAALAHVVVRSLEPEARPEPVATSSLARRVPGLLASFVAGQ
jgi:WD40 repeat protein